MGQHTPGKVLAISRPELSWTLLALLLLRCFPVELAVLPKSNRGSWGRGGAGLELGCLCEALAALESHLNFWGLTGYQCLLGSHAHSWAHTGQEGR